MHDNLFWATHYLSDVVCKHEMTYHDWIGPSEVAKSAQFKLGQNDEAIKAYDGAITVKPEHPDAYDRKDDVYFKLEEYQKALEYYDKALKIKPDHSLILQCKKEALRNLKKIDQPKKEANSTRIESRSPVQTRPPSSSRTVSVAWDAIIDKKVKSYIPQLEEYRSELLRFRTLLYVIYFRYNVHGQADGSMVYGCTGVPQSVRSMPCC